MPDDPYTELLDACQLLVNSVDIRPKPKMAEVATVATKCLAVHIIARKRGISPAAQWLEAPR
jgi:hypothetical protein